MSKSAIFLPGTAIFGRMDIAATKESGLARLITNY